MYAETLQQCAEQLTMQDLPLITQHLYAIHATFAHCGWLENDILLASYEQLQVQQLNA